MCKPLSVLVRLIPMLVASLALAVLPSAAQEATDTPSAPLYREIIRWGETDRTSPDWRSWSEVEWSPNGERLAALGRNVQGPQINIWDAQTGEELATLDEENLYGFDWSPDGERIAGITDDGSNLVIYIWNLATGEVSDTLVWESDLEYTRAYIIDWSPDGRHLATTGHDLVVWDLEDRSSQALHRYWEGGTDVAWSPDSQKLAAVGVNRIEVGIPGASTDVTLQVWEVEDEQVLLDTIGYKTVSWSPTGTQIATGMIEKLKVFNATTGETVFEAGDHQGNVLTVDWNRDGTRIASGGVDMIVRIWDAHTGELLNSLSGHTEFIGSVAWSPQRDLLATASVDGTIRIWGQ